MYFLRVHFIRNAKVVSSIPIIGTSNKKGRITLKDDARMLFQAADDLERMMTEYVIESVQIVTCTLVGGYRQAKEIADLSSE